MGGYGISITVRGKIQTFLKWQFRYPVFVSMSLRTVLEITLLSNDINIEDFNKMLSKGIVI